MALEREFDGISHDTFYGLGFRDNGVRDYVSVDLTTGDFVTHGRELSAFATLAFNYCDDVAEERKPLLLYSPGYVEREGKRTHFVPLSSEERGLVLAIVKNFASHLIPGS